MLKSHSGEISFPGGQYSRTSDSNLLDTALRETAEEIGLSIRAENVIGRLESVYTLTSNYIIVPFLTTQRQNMEPRPYSKEVESIIDVPLLETLGTFQPDTEHYHLTQQDVYKFTYQQIVVWGATARILKQLYERLLI